MKNILNLVQIVVSVFLILLILLQSKGSGLGSAFTGKSDLYSTKRGFEKTIFILTIVLAAVFLISSIAQSIIF